MFKKYLIKLIENYINLKLKLHNIWHKSNSQNVALAEFKKVLDNMYPNHTFIFESDNDKRLNAGFIYKSKEIKISYEWIIRFFFHKTEEFENSFKQTIGHEFAHEKDYRLNDKKYQLYIHKIPTKDNYFINWVREVHCDFSGIKNGLNANRKNGIRAMDYKMRNRHNKYFKNISHDYLTHPAYVRRLKYVSLYDFDDALIDEIAKDTKCKNRKLIETIKEYYEYIYLK